MGGHLFRHLRGFGRERDFVGIEKGHVRRGVSPPSGDEAVATVVDDYDYDYLIHEEPSKLLPRPKLDLLRRIKHHERDEQY